MSEASSDIILSKDSETDSGEETSSGYVYPLELHIKTYFGHSTGADGEISYKTGYGGLIRDDGGKWVKGFMGHLAVKHFDLEAELLALYHGLCLLIPVGKEKDDIFLSEYLGEAMIRHLNTGYPDCDLITQCLLLWGQNASSLYYDMPAKTAEAAEWLAKKGVTEDIGFEVVDVVPTELEHLFSK